MSLPGMATDLEKGEAATTTSQQPVGIESSSIPKILPSRKFFGALLNNTGTKSKQSCPPVETLRGRSRSPDYISSMRRRRSCERAGVFMFKPTKASSRRNSFDSLLDPAFRQSERQVQRQKMMSYLKKDIGNSDPGPTPELSADEQGARLLELADKYYSERTLRFNRFERLCILNLLHAQHNLTKIDERIQYEKKGNLSGDVSNDLHQGILIYVNAIEAMQKISSLRQPGFEASNSTGRELALALHEPRYWESTDALNLFDLSLPAAGSSIDRLRLELQKVAPLKLLDSAGKERREIDEGAEILQTTEEDSSSTTVPGVLGSAAKKSHPAWIPKLFFWRKTTPKMPHILDDLGPNETKRIITSYLRQPLHISPFIDNSARLLVALIGGLLVLVPTAVLSYITELRWMLLATFLFTILFSVMVSVMSRASNEQIIMATAAYGAILVVFVANNLQGKGKSG